MPLDSTTGVVISWKACQSFLLFSLRSSRGGFLGSMATLSKTLIIEQSYKNDAVVMYYDLLISGCFGAS